MKKELHLVTLSLLSIIMFASCDKSEDIFESENNSNENWEFAYAENYVDSLNAIFSDEGYVVLFGGTEMRLSSDVEKLERTIYVAKADFESGIIDEEKSTLIVVDSTYMPIQISSNNCIIRFSAFENGNFSCLVNYGDETEWTEYDGFNLGSLNTFSKASTRSLATGGVSDFTIANALKALDIINGLKGCFQSTSMKECISEGVGVFSNFIPNDEASVTGGLISAGLTKSLSSGLLSILSYAGDKIADGPLKYLGPVKLSIESVEQIDAQSCEIGYMVDGLHEYGMTNSDLYFEIRNVKTGKYYPRLYLDSKNGYENAVIRNLEPGEYGIILHIRTKKYNWEYTTYPEVKFSIFNLELDRYEIEDNPLYKNGAVNFKMNIYLKGNEESLKDIQQFGYYIKYANVIDYKQVKSLSSIFESTPLTYELLIPRDGFSDETTNYTTFEAKPSIDYYIGVYAVLKNGDIVHYDEETIDGLVYNREPSFTISNIVITDRGPYSDGTGRDSYMSYTVDYTVDGGLFVSQIYEKYGENWTSSGAEYIIFNEFDDNTTHTRKGTINYDSENTKASPISFFAILKNGSKHQFNQGMVFQGGALSVNGGTRSISSRQTATKQHPMPLIIINE